MQLKSTHKSIREYHESLADLSRHGVVNEMGVRSAFQALLDGTAKTRKFRFVPEQRSGTGLVRPDGVIYDENHLPRGWWEAKDSKDDLTKEITKKIAKGYPTTNIIFEDGRRAVLLQNARETYTADLGNAEHVATLLNTFYEFTPPAYKDFEQAKERFKDAIPDLAKGLLAKIEEGHKKNKEFRAAFDAFFELCQTSLNPNIRKEAVEEMLVQHLLTERLIRTVFENPDFVRRNVIASEVEKVLDALFAGSESRQAYLRNLDRFYVAIEEAARSIPEFHDKQHFLNTVYERFFQGYSVKLADTHGIVYTPQPIVDFMCASVAEVLKTEFGKTLGSKDVYIIDPCTGTGNFIVNLLGRIDGKDIERVYKHQLFANEVMLLPYYIAALNIEHAYFERTGHYEPFEGLCFVDTLDLTLLQHEKAHSDFFSTENTKRVNRQRSAPITVVIGNPPYNANQVNENDNNKNRDYYAVEKTISSTYAKDSRATNRNKLDDPYVKFIRWATDRLQGRDGVVCLITNNSFVEQVAFDGMRKHLVRDFDTFYHLDLHGNVYRNPKLSGTTNNVFGIKVGVGITIAVRNRKGRGYGLQYFRVPELWRKEEKYEFLKASDNVACVKWQALLPDSSNSWFPAGHADEFEQLIPLGTKEAKAAKIRYKGEEHNPKVVFKLFSNGVKTNRDDVVLDYSESTLLKRIKRFIADYNVEVVRYGEADTDEAKDVDSFVNYDRVNWSDSLKSKLEAKEKGKLDKDSIRTSLYRPFEKRYLYFDRLLVERVYRFPSIFPNARSEGANLVICVSGVASSKPFHSLMSATIVDVHLTGDTQCFPFYVYNEDGTGRRENITDWALAEFQKRYGASAGALAAAKDCHPEPPLSPQISDLGPGVDGGEGSHVLTGKKRKQKILPADGQDDKAIGKWEIFYYVYGLLHHPGYREKYADNLKRELPRIPYAPDFWAFSKAGKKLAELHLKYEELKPIWESDSPLPAGGLGEVGKDIRLVVDPKAKPRDVWHVEKMKLSKPQSDSLSPHGGEGVGDRGLRDLTINKHVSVTNIPPEVFEYRLGNRSALEWVVDQYQIKKDKRSGIESDPNREDDPEYIVRLVGQVIRVSLETVKIVHGLPKEFE